MVNKKQIMINERLYEVVDPDKYYKNPDAYLTGYTAIDSGEQYVLPVIPINATQPGIYIRKNSPFSYGRLPKPHEHPEQYDRKNIIDYSSASTYKDFIEKRQMVRELEKSILTTPDNIFTPAIDENDTPAMAALKQAIIQKHIDLDRYEPRFGSNYNNEKRIFIKPNISLPKLVRICNALDIKATLTLEDQVMDNGDTVPNPMKNPITVELTSGSAYSDEEE